MGLQKVISYHNDGTSIERIVLSDNALYWLMNPKFPCKALSADLGNHHSGLSFSEEHRFPDGHHSSRQIQN